MAAFAAMRQVYSRPQSRIKNGFAFVDDDELLCRQQGYLRGH